MLPGSLNDVKKESLMKGMVVEGTQWFTVNYVYASKVLKDVFENYKNYKFNATEQGKINRGKFLYTSINTLELLG
jgi:hypothetical protein